MFLGPETSQETLKKPKSRPRSTQRAPKAHAKNCQKNTKKCYRGKKCLKLAISFKIFLGTNFGGQICNVLSSSFNILLISFRGTFGTHLGAILSDLGFQNDLQNETKNEFKNEVENWRPSKCFQNLPQGPPKEVQERKLTSTRPKMSPRGVPKMAQKTHFFGSWAPGVSQRVPRASPGTP